MMLDPRTVKFFRMTVEELQESDKALELEYLLRYEG